MSKSPFIEILPWNPLKNSLASTGKSIVRTTFFFFAKQEYVFKKLHVRTSWQYDLSKRFQVSFWIRTLLCMKILKLCILVRDFSNNLCCMSNRLSKICNLKHNELLIYTSRGIYNNWRIWETMSMKSMSEKFCQRCW